MSPKHTPGPWHAFPYGDTAYVTGPITKGSPEYIAKELKLENAHLIAAAPEMFTLLHALWAKMDPNQKECGIIAKLLDRIENTSTR